MAFEDEGIARSLTKILQDVAPPNSVAPTGGFGLTLDENGRIPQAAVLAEYTGTAGTLQVDATGAVTWAEASAPASSVGTFTGKNNASLAAIALSAETFDDLGVLSTSDAFETIVVNGDYLVSAYCVQSGASGTGGGQVEIRHSDSGGTLISVLGWELFGMNEAATVTAVVRCVAGERIVLSTQNGATGAAGTCAGRLSITKMA